MGLGQQLRAVRELVCYGLLQNALVLNRVIGTTFKVHWFAFVNMGMNLGFC
jgi:hypothetical protein